MGGVEELGNEVRRSQLGIKREQDLSFSPFFFVFSFFIWNFAARYKWFALWQQEWWRKQSPGYFLTKLKANVKKVVEIFGQSDIGILTLHPKVVEKRVWCFKKSFGKRAQLYLTNSLSDV